MGKVDMVKGRKERTRNWDLGDIIELLDQATPTVYIYISGLLVIMLNDMILPIIDYYCPNIQPAKVS